MMLSTNELDALLAKIKTSIEALELAAFELKVSDGFRANCPSDLDIVHIARRVVAPVQIGGKNVYTVGEDHLIEIVRRVLARMQPPA